MPKIRIMLVEDEAITALCIRDSLEHLGYDLVATIALGREAVKRAMELKPDLILMDITLADDMTGIEAAEQIRQTEKIPIIFLTAHTDSATLARAKQSGPFGYLTKPYQLDTLKSTIEIALFKSAADARIRESEKHYRMLFQSMHNGFALHEIICDETGRPCDYRFIEVNPAFEVLTGLKAAEITGKTVLEVLPATEPYWIDLYGKVALSGESLHVGNFSAELQRHFDVQAYSPEPGRFATIIADVTALKKQEEMALLVARGVSSQMGENFFQSLTQHLAQLLDTGHAFLGELIGDEVNVIAGVLHGQKITSMRYNLKGTPCAQAFVDKVVCLYPHGVQEAFPEDHDLKTMGIEGYAGNVLCDADGKPIGIIVVLFSQVMASPALVVSLLQIFAARAGAELERRQTQQILLESEARYKKLFHEFETIVNGIPDALTLWSAEMRLLWANKGGLDQLKSDLPALLGKECMEICSACHGNPQGCEVRRCFRSQTIENRLQVDPEGRTWGAKAFPLIDDSGVVTQVIRLSSDLTERMHLREEAARSAHLAALGELAAGVAHEINNPTGLILLEMPILRDAFRDARPILEAHYQACGDFSFAGMKYSELRDQLGPMIAEISEGALRIKRIVDELKDFSRPVEGNPFAPVDLNEVVRKASSLVAGRIKKLTDAFSVEYADAAVMVSGNFQKLEQVVINLIVNACQALTERSAQVLVQISTAQPRGFALITVRDEGVGILPEHLPVITDPFFTTRRESGGTGLGLSVSMRIVEEHQGTMRFDSAPKRGTLVTLELPLAEELGR